MQPALILASVIEAATGLALLFAPSLVGRALLAAPLTGVAVPAAGVAGIALTAFAISCWPGPPLVGMLTYNVGVALYLAHVGLSGGPTGILLWPAAALHLVMAAALALGARRA